MALFGSVREDIILLLATVFAILLAVLGLTSAISPFELSQLLIVLVFLGIAVVIAERVARNQKLNDSRLETVESNLKGIGGRPSASVSAVQPPISASAPIAAMSPVLMQLPSPPRTPPIQAEVIPTVASCTVEYLADESKKAELIESILRWTAQRHEGYRVYITAENADDRQGPTPNGLPVREEACLGPVNAGRIGLMRVFLDLTANHQEELQKNGRENVGRWMVTLRNKVVPGYRDTLLRQVVVKGYQFVPMMMCVPTFDTPDETAPVHMVFALGQPQRIAGVSSAVHLVMKSSVFKKSFFADWIRDVQENPDYEYDKSEEQTFVGQNLIVSATEFNRVDQRVAKLLSDRIASLAGEPSSDSYGGATAEVAANRMMHDEYLKAEWTDLIDSLTRMRDLLSSGFEFSANK